MSILNIFKSEQKLVAEIHNEFDTAQERLLQQAKEFLSKNQNSIGKRAIEVGFTSTPSAKRHRETTSTREQAELIEYYKQNYPFLKFLTVPELDRICKKYNLIYSESSRYIKDIPEKNIRDIETAQKLKMKDAPIRSTWGMDFGLSTSIIRSSFYEELIQNRFGVPTGIEITRKSPEEATVDSELYICAPKSHFDLKGTKRMGLRYFTEPKDPIVFRHVKGGVQIITKWGLEAEDPELFVDKLN